MDIMKNTPNQSEATIEKQPAGVPKENRLGVEPVHSLLIRTSIPLMISMLVQSLYNIVDSIFVAQINEDALTAVSFCFPVQQLIISFAIGTAVGFSALMSRYLGAKDFKRVNKIAAHGLFLEWVTYIPFLLVGFFARPFMEVQSDNPRIIEYGTTYLSIVCFLSIMVFTQISLERFMQSTGKTLFIFFTQTLGAVINIIMDPILIFGWFGFPEMGVAGAAVATVFGQFVAAVLALYLNVAKNKEIHLSFRGFRPEGHIIKEIYQIAAPSIVMQSIGSVMTFAFNQILAAFTSTAVAALGIYFKLQSFVFMPVFGMNNGIVPIAAYNYGAGKRKRLERVMSLGVRYGVACMAVGMLIFMAVPDLLLSFFNASEELHEIGRTMLRIAAIIFPMAGYSIMRGSVFQAVGRSNYSLYISVIRQIGVLLPAAWLLAQTGILDLVWWALPIAEIIGMLCSVHFTKIVRRDIISKVPYEPEPLAP